MKKTIKIDDGKTPPKLYTLIFRVDGKFKAWQGVYYSLEQALSESKNSDDKLIDEFLWWHFVMSHEDIVKGFNTLY